MKTALELCRKYKRWNRAAGVVTLWRDDCGIHLSYDWGGIVVIGELKWLKRKWATFG